MKENMNRYGTFFVVERVSDSVTIYYFDRRKYAVSHDDIKELALSLSLATDNAVTVVQDYTLVFRGVLVAFMNPLTARPYLPDLVDQYVKDFFDKHQKDEDDVDDDELEYVE